MKKRMKYICCLLLAASLTAGLWQDAVMTMPEQRKRIRISRRKKE